MSDEALLNHQAAADPQILVDAFRSHYSHYEHLVREAILNPTDSTILAHLGDELDSYLQLVVEVCLVSPMKEIRDY